MEPGLFGVWVGFGNRGGWNCEIVFFDEGLGAWGVEGDHGSFLFAVGANVFSMREGLNVWIPTVNLCIHSSHKHIQLLFYPDK